MFSQITFPVTLFLTPVVYYPALQEVLESTSYAFDKPLRSLHACARVLSIPFSQGALNEIYQNDDATKAELSAGVVHRSVYERRCFYSSL